MIECHMASEPGSWSTKVAHIVGQQKVKVNKVQKDQRLKNQLQYDKGTPHLPYPMIQQQTPIFQGC